MELRDIQPLGRVPKGEPGYDFYRSKEGTAVPPVQKGVVVAHESMEHMDQVEPAAFLEGGDYVVYSCSVVEEDGIRPDHVAVALRDGDTPFAWIVQSDEVLQGDAAEDLMGPTFRWSMLKPDTVLMDMRRAMSRARFMFPEIRHLAIIYDMGPGPQVECMEPEFMQFVQQALLNTEN